jgi:hypothetical protein
MCRWWSFDRHQPWPPARWLTSLSSSPARLGTGWLLLLLLFPRWMVEPSRRRLSSCRARRRRPEEIWSFIILSNNPVASVFVSVWLFTIRSESRFRCSLGFYLQCLFGGSGVDAECVLRQGRGRRWPIGGKHKQGIGIFRVLTRFLRSGGIRYGRATSVVKDSLE